MHSLERDLCDSELDAHTATDFNGHSGPQTVEEGAEHIVAMATVGADGPTATFSDRPGALPW